MSKRTTVKKVLSYVSAVLVVLLVIMGVIIRNDWRQKQQSDATRTDFIADCKTDPQATDSYCTCVYDTMGEQAMLEAYEHYKTTNEYNAKFKTVAAGCVKLEQSI